jgi:hypothetical protein
MALRLMFAGLLLGATASCTFTEPGELANHGDGPIAGISVEKDGPDQVLAALGKPSARANGWWRDEHQFDMDFRVWYYKGLGRVIFDHRGRVFATEADKSQSGAAN